MGGNNNSNICYFIVDVIYFLVVIIWEPILILYGKRLLTSWDRGVPTWYYKRWVHDWEITIWASAHIVVVVIVGFVVVTVAVAVAFCTYSETCYDEDSGTSDSLLVPDFGDGQPVGQRPHILCFWVLLGVGVGKIKRTDIMVLGEN